MSPALILQIIEFVTPLLKAAFGDHLPTDLVGKLLGHAIDLFSIGADLTDGSGYLSVESRNILAGLVLDLKAGKL